MSLWLPSSILLCFISLPLFLSVSPCINPIFSWQLSLHRLPYHINRTLKWHSETHCQCGSHCATFTHPSLCSKAQDSHTQTHTSTCTNTQCCTKQSTYKQTLALSSAPSVFDCGGWGATRFNMVNCHHHISLMMVTVSFTDNGERTFKRFIDNKMI